ncbi:hypothetical protein QN277_008530 [Acacia crassicarpa]|uniref:Protein E6-like n=1 Tax=Acacia crassicarpa TaxID=499986 RepID=A0AAE1IS68_9FABA|nr:hypothetical protein QN277_008530 [Acacia crassicarpa]
MTSHNLSSFFFLLIAFVLLILSPHQTQAREGKFFSFFSHFSTTSHKLKSHHPHSPSPSPSPSPSSSESIAATPESILAAPAPAPESSTEAGTTPVPSPADQSEFRDRGDGYGLYGTTSFENNNDNHESFKKGFGTKLYSNYNNNNNKELYRNSYNNNNNQEYYSNDHRTNNYYEDSYYSANNNNKNNDRYSYKNNNNFYDNNNGYNGGYERKREGMSDTRFVENGKYFYDLNQNHHYEVEGYKPTGRGSTTYTENNNYGGSYYENNNNYRKYPNEFDTMEEYEKQQEKQGYVP